MNKNMGLIDRVLRIVVALIITLWLITGAISGIGAIATGVLAGVLILSSSAGSCPLYVPLRISTRRNSDREDE